MQIDNLIRARAILLSLVLVGCLVDAPMAAQQVLKPGLHHVRTSTEREWNDFPENAEQPKLVVRFEAKNNQAEQTLRLRQQDVKQPWRVLLNDKELGRLIADENDTIVYFTVPAGRLIDGENDLVVEQTTQTPDDIRVGDVALDERPLKEVLSEASVEVSVFDATNADKPVLTPCRITVANSQGALMTTSAVSDDSLAVRPGVIYTANGQARFGLPAGEYSIYAGRGFEYGIASTRLSLKPGALVQKRMLIHREVPTDGYVSCDTHVHTLTYSGHGDATLDERMLTIAGEGLELPIATDHNRQIDYEPAARRLGVRKYFTPVVGNEVTTTVGHFNIFPVTANGPVPDSQLKDGHAVLDSIAERTRSKIIVLNHGQDLHSGFRPFGPERHNAVTGENRAPWLMRANAMEVVNSGAQQTDLLRLYRDWFGLLNRGIQMTPVGASDSHDVSRFIVGQARTYIRCTDDDPGEIDIDKALESFVAGRVLVSCGLLVEMSVNSTYGPGDIVPRANEAQVTLRVVGPSWTTAERITLYANGVEIRTAEIPEGKRAGAKWSETWTLARLNHDVHLVAIATGPGVRQLYWPIAKPYQPTSPDVRRTVIGSTGTIWIDNDGDGKRTSAFDYAQRLMAEQGDSVEKLVIALADYDEAVAAQVAGLLQARGTSIDDREVREAAKKAGEHIERGFRAFFDAWRAMEIARAQTR
jgi:hypothetical protein